MNLAKARDMFAIIKYRFDIGMSFMVFINLSLLITANLDKIQGVINLPPLVLFTILIPSAFLGTCFFGFFLDIVSKYQTAYTKHAHSHSPQITGTLEIVKDIQERVIKLEKRK